MTKKTLKITILLLILLMTLCLMACNKKEEEPVYYEENRRLEIVEVPIEYTEEELAAAKNRVTQIFTSSFSSSLFGNITTKVISEEFDLTVVPALYELKIHKDELNKILTELEKYTKSEEPTASAPIWLSIYNICQRILGTDRSGRIAYKIAVRKLERNVINFSTLEALELVARYTALCDALKTLGAEKFTDALSMVTIVISTVSAIGKDIEENAFLLSDKEILYILDKQGENIKNRCLTEDEWQVFGAVASEFIPKKNNDLNYATLYALKNYVFDADAESDTPEDYYKKLYFASAMRVMPQIVNLFADISHALNEEGLFSIESTEDEKKTAICSALLKCEDSIRALDEALNTYAKLDKNILEVYTPLNNYINKDSLSAFMENYQSATCDDLINTVNEIASDESVSVEELSDVIVSYVYGLSPHIAFVFWFNMQ